MGKINFDIGEYILGLKPYALKLTRNVDDANDLLNDVAVRVLETESYDSDKIDSKSGIHGWLNVIMHNQFLQNYSKNISFIDLWSPKSNNIESEELVDDKTPEENLIYEQESKINKVYFNNKLIKSQEITIAAVSLLTPYRKKAVNYYINNKRGMVGYHTHLYNARQDIFRMGGDLEILKLNKIP